MTKATSAASTDSNVAPHTPGPWSYGLTKSGKKKVFAPNGYEIVRAMSTNSYRKIHPVEREANAHLIAAAPDLLAACVAALNDRMFKDWPEVATLLHKAIGKAYGK